MNKPRPKEDLSIWLDVIRAAAAQAVVLGHVHQIFFSGQVLLPETLLFRISRVALDVLGSVSHQAVIAFFVMSGYLVGGRVLLDFRNGKFRPLRYFSDRCTRLWVVLLPALVLTAALDLIAFKVGAGNHILVSRQPFYPTWWASINPWGIKSAVSNAAFMQMIATLQYGTNLSIWSISNEFWYYILFPCLLFGAAGRGVVRVAGAIAAILIFTMFSVSGAPHFTDRAQYLFYYFLIWTAGAAAPFVRGIWRIALGCAGLTYAFAWGWRRHFTIDPSFWGDAAVTALVLGFICLCQTLPARRLAAPAKFFAGYSYSLYAIHLPVAFFLMSFDPVLNDKVAYGLADNTRYVAYVAISNVAGLMFWYFTERHTNTIRYRLRTWMELFERPEKAQSTD